MCVWLHVYSFTGTHDCSIIIVLKHISPFEFSLPKFMHQFLFVHHILDGALSVTLSGLFVSFYVLLSWTSLGLASNVCVKKGVCLMKVKKSSPC